MTLLKMRPLAILCLLLAGLFLLLLFTGRWRSSGVGPQVQVPMFYDAHYLFPRPWTQEQEAPGVPPPAPLSVLYGPNRVTQSFIAGADRLSMVEVWLAGPAGAGNHPLRRWRPARGGDSPERIQPAGKPGTLHLFARGATRPLVGTSYRRTAIAVPVSLALAAIQTACL